MSGSPAGLAGEIRRVAAVAEDAEFRSERLMPIVDVTPEALAEAARALRHGRLVALPTETVYGLAADATSGEAVARIFEAKGRPRFNPLIVHLAGTVEADVHAELSPLAQVLAAAFWPGPLTLVLPRKRSSPVCDLATAGLDTVALRVPDHATARALIAATGRPLAAPSANRSGHVSATTARHVAADLGHKVSLVLDGGPTHHGIESTVLAVVEGHATLLRPGAVTVEAIERIAGHSIARATDDGAAPRSPGQLASHYAPAAQVRLDVTRPAPGEALLAFGPAVPHHDGPVVNLSPDGDLIEAAARLFWALRELDASGARTIAVMPIPDAGLGEAIVDRLRRAAAAR